MAYTELSFKDDYKAAVERRVDAKLAAGIVNKTSQEAWKLYENARTAPLGLQVFGRHKKNPSDLKGEPGIELFGEVFPKFKKKRLFGLLGTSTESTKKWEARTSGFQTQLEHPTYPERKKTPMEFNFGVVSHASTGGILMMGNDVWNLNINDAWVTGGVHAHQPFYIAFKLSYENVFTDTFKHNLTITGRELLGLLLAGYQLEINREHEQLGGAMVCAKATEADELTLDDYSMIAQLFEGPLKGMDVLSQFRNQLDQLPQTEQDRYRQSVARAEEMRQNFVAIAREAGVNL